MTTILRWVTVQGRSGSNAVITATAADLITFCHLSLQTDNPLIKSHYHRRIESSRRWSVFHFQLIYYLLLLLSIIHNLSIGGVEWVLCELSIKGYHLRHGLSRKVSRDCNLCTRSLGWRWTGISSQAAGYFHSYVMLVLVVIHHKVCVTSLFLRIKVTCAFFSEYKNCLCRVWSWFYFHKTRMIPSVTFAATAIFIDSSKFTKLLA